jgi:DNA repair protein RecO (recombination protein O)
VEKVRRRGGKGGIPTGLIPLGIIPDRLSQGDYRAVGVVLKRKEAPKSRECILFLRGLGAVQVVSPGEKNRFGGGTEPMTWGNFALYQSTHRMYLKGVDIVEDFLPLRRSRRSLSLAVKWCGKLAARLPSGHENDGVLRLLWGSMKNVSLGLSPLLLDVRFAWRWCGVWGVAPSMDFCSGCGASLESSRGVCASQGGFLCEDCSGREGAARRGFAGAEAFAAVKAACVSPRDVFIRESSKLDDMLSGRDDLKSQLEETASLFYSFLVLV